MSVWLIFFKKEALDRLKWHKDKGDKIVIVSASLFYYLSPWAIDHGYELICSELSTTNGRLNGFYKNSDCTGIQKRKRVEANYDLSSYNVVYAYGDTDEDAELLSIADHSYLNWILMNSDDL